MNDDTKTTLDLVRDLRNTLAAAMRTFASGGTCDDFIAEAANAGVSNGIGQRADAWLGCHDKSMAKPDTHRSRKGKTLRPICETSGTHKDIVECVRQHKRDLKRKARSEP